MKRLWSPVRPECVNLAPVHDKTRADVPRKTGNRLSQPLRHHTEIICRFPQIGDARIFGDPPKRAAGIPADATANHGATLTVAAAARSSCGGGERESKASTQAAGLTPSERCKPA